MMVRPSLTAPAHRFQPRSGKANGRSWIAQFALRRPAAAINHKDRLSEAPVH